MKGNRTIIMAGLCVVSVTVLMALGKLSTEAGIPLLVTFGGAGVGRGFMGARGPG